MAATALDADRLKREAGIRNTGRKSDQSVYAYTLAWHPDEAKSLSRAEMVRAADETLRVLGADDRQAILVCHTDRPHPHVHIIVNRVSPQDGRMLGTSNDRLKLSQWALSYRQMRGQEQYCPQRAENWHMRLSRHDDRGRLKLWRARADTPRSMIEDVRAAKAGADPKAAELIAAQKQRIGKLAAGRQGDGRPPCPAMEGAWRAGTGSAQPYLPAMSEQHFRCDLDHQAKLPAAMAGYRPQAGGRSGVSSAIARRGLRERSAMRSMPWSMPANSIPKARAAFWAMRSTI